MELLSTISNVHNGRRTNELEATTPQTLKPMAVFKPKVEEILGCSGAMPDVLHLAHPSIHGGAAIPGAHLFLQQHIL